MVKIRASEICKALGIIGAKDEVVEFRGEEFVPSFLGHHTFVDRLYIRDGVPGIEVMTGKMFFDKYGVSILEVFSI